MALLTVLAVAGKPYMPPKTLLIHPQLDVTPSIYGHEGSVESGVLAWIDRENYEWRCDYAIAYGPANCGFTLSWNSGLFDGRARDSGYPECESAQSDESGDGWGWENEQSCIVVRAETENDTDGGAEDRYPVCMSAHSNDMGGGWGWEYGQRCIAEDAPDLPHSQASARRLVGDEPPNTTDAPSGSGGDSEVWVDGIDFSRYDGMNVTIHYEGRANFLRLYLRNYNPLYASDEDLNSTKFMATFLPTEDLKAGAAYVPLADFSVEEWWVLRANPPRVLAGPEFDRIVTVGVDHVEHGLHKMRVDRLELVGERISTENFLLAILIFWGGFLFVEASLRYYHLYSSSRQSAAQLDELSNHARTLEQEKDLLKTRSVTDALTGVLNRTGIDEQLQTLYTGETPPSGFGIMMLDIDHFKPINDSRGHDVGDRILKDLANLLVANIREDDIFARWGGEEFLLVTRRASEESLMQLADKLRSVVADHTFEAVLDLRVTVSIGVSKVRKGDTFSATVKRADTALYKAKITRNSVIYE